MENKCRSSINWWAMLASLMTGVLIGVVGTLIGKRLLEAHKYRLMERDALKYDDYDFEDYYDDLDDERLYREELDDYIDETEALSF